MSGTDKSDRDYYRWGQRDKLDNELDGEGQAQLIDCQTIDFSYMGASMKPDHGIHEDGMLVLDINEVPAQEDDIPQMMDEIPQNHNQAGTSSILDMYLEQQSSEEPWKASENRK